MPLRSTWLWLVLGLLVGGCVSGGGPQTSTRAPSDPTVGPTTGPTYTLAGVTGIATFTGSWNASAVAAAMNGTGYAALSMDETSVRSAPREGATMRVQRAGDAILVRLDYPVEPAYAASSRADADRQASHAWAGREAAFNQTMAALAQPLSWARNDTSWSPILTHAD